METNMIEVRGAYKRYSTTPVLQGLDMTVKTGTIYGLLGPSGCGKTTILSCIVARKFLDSGYINLGVKKKSEIGYMPQDTALFPELTMKEIFKFYGTLFKMPSHMVRKRSEELVELLELPKLSRVVGTLSGGQQRRVSFAVALLHDPKLLILDEPTVGMDPILCDKIWQHLVHLSTKENKTVVITTHYIEEARQSNMIALMRGGVLLAEETPRDLMGRYNSSTLEQAFLELSKKQHDTKCKELEKGEIPEYPRVKPSSAPSPIQDDDWFQFSRFSAQLSKNIKWTCRNFGMLIFALLVPSIQSYFYCVSFGRDPKGLRLGVVSEELMTESCDTRNLTYSDLFDCSIPRTFTCEFLNQLEQRIDVDLFDDVNEAKQAVQQNLAWAVIKIPRNFTSAVSDRIYEGFRASEEVLNDSSIEMWMDTTNYVIASLVQRKVSQSMIDFIKEVMKTCDNNTKGLDIPIKFEPVYGTIEPIFAHSSTSGFLAGYAFYFPMLFTSGAVIVDRMTGIRERLIVAGMNSKEMAAAHLVVQFVLMFLQNISQATVMYGVYDNPFIGNPLLAFALLYSTSIVGVALGYFLAEAAIEERLVAYAGIGTVMMLFLINGTCWPMEAGHFLVSSWSRWFPVVAVTDGLSGINQRGFGFSHPFVYMAFVSCFCWTVILSLGSCFLHSRNKRI